MTRKQPSSLISANDYKLIRIGVYYRHPVGQYQVRADLYAMSTDMWTEIDVDKLLLFFGEGDERGYNAYRHFGGSWASAVLNGVFYWRADEVRTHQVIIMPFDMGDEVFRQIRTPPCFSKKWDGTNFQFTEWKDKLALVISYSHDQCLDVWVLNEDQSSWANQMKVGYVPSVSRNMGTGEVVKIRVVGCAKNGQLLVTNHKLNFDEEEEGGGGQGGAMAGSQSTAARTKIHLPFEITIEILSRLPVKSLLRFKSVCKAWQYNIRADLYVMSTGTWREIDVNKLSSFFGEMSEFGEYYDVARIDGYSASVLNGVFYWSAREVQTYQVIVISFDMGDEPLSDVSSFELIASFGG
ncbi:hypothetical protein RHMOL_Rhmol05G0290400 [Rhododendron molle]|uniref:Uncharacterized protein n=1 Tax=Rhododendron molle TaxID=49168 RepID=A0ACC0NVG5_RHOML|nr:hypothetical protein RHMOL_Rhmol05G0290400 [Rhododendron molle]